MIEELTKFIAKFPGEANHTRCFLHILSLVAKAIIKLFDAPKKSSEGDDESDLNDELLAKLAEGIELEEEETRAALEHEEDNDDDEGLVDEIALLSETEKAEFDAVIIPVQLVIVKVSQSSRKQKGGRILTSF